MFSFYEERNNEKPAKDPNSPVLVDDFDRWSRARACMGSSDWLRERHGVLPSQMDHGFQDTVWG